MQRIFLLSILFSALLFSCVNELEDKVDVDQMVEEIKSAQLEGEEQRCAEMLFPVTYKMPDGTTITINAKGELKTTLAEWYKNNPETKEKPALVFPVEMNFKGKIFTINNEKELYKIRIACAGKKGKGDADMEKRIAAYLLEAGIPKEKLKEAMGGLKKAMYEAKGKGSSYQMSEELQQYLSKEIGLSDEQIEKIRTLAIRILLSKESGTDGEN